MLKKKDCVACGYCELAGQLSIRTRILLPEKTNARGVSMYVCTACVMFKVLQVEHTSLLRKLRQAGQPTAQPTDQPTHGHEGPYQSYTTSNNDSLHEYY